MVQPGLGRQERKELTRIEKENCGKKEDWRLLNH
jgi:hypothetical protein